MRFLHSGIVNIALLGLSTVNLSAIAATPPVASVRVPTIDRIAIYDSSRTIRGNGVEFRLPAGFKGGSPSNAQTRAAIAQTAKMFPSMASIMQVFESNPSIVRAIATSTDSQQVPSMVLVTQLPIPASVSLAEIQEMMAKFIPSMLPPEFTLVDNQLLNVGSRQIVRLSIDVNIQGIQLKESIGLFKTGNQIFQVTYVYDPESSQQAMPVFEQIINTFKATSKT